MRDKIRDGRIPSVEIAGRIYVIKEQLAKLIARAVDKEKTK